MRLYSNEVILPLIHNLQWLSILTYPALRGKISICSTNDFPQRSIRISKSAHVPKSHCLSVASWPKRGTQPLRLNLTLTTISIYIRGTQQFCRLILINIILSENVVVKLGFHPPPWCCRIHFHIAFE